MQRLDGITQYQNHAVRSGQAGQASAAGGTAAPGQEQAQLPKGTVFAGTVTEVKGDYVQLSLDNGQTIRARLESGVNVRMGEPVLYEVKSNQDNQIMLRQVPVNSSYNPTLQKALAAAGLKLTERNLDMVNQMMMKQLPIDKGSLNAMARLVQNHAQASVETLVQLKKLGFTIDPGTVQQFESYRAGEHSLLERFSQLMEQIPELSGETGQAAGGRQMIALQNSIMSALELWSEPGVRDTSQLIPQQGEAQIPPGGTEMTQDPAQTGLGTQGAQGAQGAAAAEQAMTEQQVQQAQGALKDGQPQQMQGALKAGEPQQMQGTLKAGQAAGTLEPPVSAVLTETDITALDQQLSRLSGMRENTALYPEGTLNTQLSAKEMLTLIQNNLNQWQGQEAQALKELFQGKPYKSLLKQAMSEQWLLEPRQLEAEKAVEKLYERMERQMAKLEQLLQNVGKEALSANRNVTQVRGNLELMNQINQLYNYVQLPLKLQNQNAHSDLYVYTNKKKLLDKEGTLSALLHLELEHLGTTDVHIKMLGNSVTANFSLSDEASYQLVGGHIEALQQSLEEKGYQCSIGLEKREQKIDIVKDFLEQEKPAGRLQRYSFDVLT